MKHCLIMTVYKDLQMVNRLIASTPQEWGIYIHIDVKSSIAANDIDARANVWKLKKIYWAGWEHLYAICFLLKQACRERYDYYHIVSTYDTESFKLYIDGELVGSVETSGDMGYPTDAGARWLCVGADSDASGMGEYFADAEISIARLYSDALSSGQVLYLFNATQTQNS